MAIPPQVRFALDILGIEVGDYHRANGILVVDRRGAYQVKLEGWGQECVDGGGVQDARRGAQALAAQWAQEGWQTVGVIDITNSEVWYITYAVGRRLKKSVMNNFDDEDILSTPIFLPIV